MKTYLITGAAGFIGANFLKYILKKYEDINVIVVDALTYAGNLGTIKEELKDRVVNYFNSHSEHIKNVDNDFNFDLSISFPLGNYDKFTKEKELLIEIPKEDLKKEVFEKELNEKEM